MFISLFLFFKQYDYKKIKQYIQKKIFKVSATGCRQKNEGSKLISYVC